MTEGRLRGRVLTLVDAEAGEEEGEKAGDKKDEGMEVEAEIS